ncbi:tryptophan-rich sensory protein [Sporosarcina sp. ANT_H38]|uniref:tryptophan-rich sensory protein n=1 Tax=Sporosarcina sp. ANT_H38 TaxID=2597358 RepID=UPI0011F21205|nr:tryptophan-rich sensory protein [Sporosarcina sp. ANT_H38]KAA0942132.1 tryptophan-rich sensory protein [Sporosarcina sp. ANT_H38]
MFKLMIMTFSLIVVVLVNAAANIIPINGKTTGEISNSLPVLFTPADYVFSIWAVIYLLVSIWLYSFMRNKGKVKHALFNRRVVLFVFSCLFNIAWILLWHFGFFGWTIIVILALLITLLTLYFTYPNLENQFYGRIPIAVYLGWTFVATIANISYVLTLHEWSGWGLSDPLWTVIYLTIATAIALHFLYHYADIAFSAVFIWAFIGITVKNGADELFVSAAALFLAATIAGFIFFRRKLLTFK